MSSSSSHPSASADPQFQLDDTVLRMLLDTHPWPETVQDLHNQFAHLHSSSSPANKEKEKQLRYLVEKVFPTLIPAMNDLSEVVRRDVDAKTGHPAAPALFPPTRCSPGIGEGQYEATGVVHPVVWLAQRLMRGGADRGVVSDAEHPFCELLKRAPPASGVTK